MGIVRLPQLAWHGMKEAEFPLPDRWNVQMCHMNGWDKPALTDSQVRDSLAAPIGSRPLREKAHGKQQVAILIDDMSRVTGAGQIARAVLEELAAAGIQDEQVRFVCALGCHGALSRLDFVKKLGEDLVARFPIYNHNPFGNCVPVGKTRTYGTSVEVNEEVMSCDLKIAIGGTVPHPMNGFGGGGKMVLPGITSFETVRHNHHQTYHDMVALRGKLGMGNYDENPMRFDVEEAAALAKLDFMVNAIFNYRGETCGLYCGALTEAYAASVKDAKIHYLTQRPADVDIAIASGFIKGNEAFIGLGIANASVSRQKGGDALLLANEPYGQVVHYLLGPFGDCSFGPEHQVSTVPQHVKRCIVYTEYPDLAGQRWFAKSPKMMFLHKWSDVLDVLGKDYPGAASVAVFPNSEVQYMR